MANLLPRILQFVGDRCLSLRGNLRGVGNAILQRLGHALQPLRNTLANSGHLPRTLRLCRPNRLQIPPQLVQLAFQRRALLLFLRSLQDQPKHQPSHHNHYPDEHYVHSFSSPSSGNGPSTLPQF